MTPKGSGESETKSRARQKKTAAVGAAWVVKRPGGTDRVVEQNAVQCT
jgi:hypothetical protein